MNWVSLPGHWVSRSCKERQLDSQRPLKNKSIGTAQNLNSVCDLHVDVSWHSCEGHQTHGMRCELLSNHSGNDIRPDESASL